MECEGSRHAGIVWRLGSVSRWELVDGQLTTSGAQESDPLSSGYGQLIGQDGGKVKRQTAGIFLDLAQGHGRVGTAAGQFDPRKVERLAAPAEPFAKRKLRFQNSLYKPGSKRITFRNASPDSVDAIASLIRSKGYRAVISSSSIKRCDS